MPTEGKLRQVQLQEDQKTDETEVERAEAYHFAWT
jgi:hypothetical protein